MSGQHDTTEERVSIREEYFHNTLSHPCKQGLMHLNSDVIVTTYIQVDKEVVIHLVGHQLEEIHHIISNLNESRLYFGATVRAATRPRNLAKA